MKHDIKDSNFVCIIAQHLITFHACLFFKSPLMSAVAFCFERLENGVRDLSLWSTCSSEILNNGIMLQRQCNETVVIKVITYLFAEAKVFNLPRVSI